MLEQDDEQAQIIDELQDEINQKASTIEWLQNEVEINASARSQVKTLEKQAKDLKESVADRDELLNEQWSTIKKLETKVEILERQVAEARHTVEVQEIKDQSDEVSQLGHENAELIWQLDVYVK